MSLYKAYTMRDVETACGCEHTELRLIYDEGGNEPRLFKSKEEATMEAISVMLGRHAHHYKVVEVANELI